jgi:hypothetical protein
MKAVVPPIEEKCAQNPPPIAISKASAQSRPQERDVQNSNVLVTKMRRRYAAMGRSPRLGHPRHCEADPVACFRQTSFANPTACARRSVVTEPSFVIRFY